MPKLLIRDAEKFLFALDHLLEETRDFDKTLRAYIRRIARSLKLGRISLMLVDKNKAELFIKEAFGLKVGIRNQTRLRVGEGIAGWVAKTEKPLLVRDIEAHPRFRKQKKSSGFHSGSFLSVPVKTGGKFYGVLNGADKSSGADFTEKDLKDFQVFAHTLALFLENQELSGQIRDTERARLDELADISHELRIPLTCLQEALALLRDGVAGPLNEVQRKYLEMAQRNIDRMHESIDLFLRWAKEVAEGGAFLRLERKRIQLHAWGEEIVRTFLPRAEKRRIDLQFSCEPPGLEVWGDPQRLGEVVMNFVDNALKYSKSDTDVAFRIESRGGKVRISVKDQGTGISEEEKRKVFDRFYRLRKAREAGVEGHGLGLAISKEIVESHQGTIGVESSEGAGSTFWLEIPLDTRQMKQEALAGRG